VADRMSRRNLKSTDSGSDPPNIDQGTELLMDSHFYICGMYAFLHLYTHLHTQLILNSGNKTTNPKNLVGKMYLKNQ